MNFRRSPRTTLRAFAPIALVVLATLAILAACSGPTAVEALDPGADGAIGATEPTTKLPHPVPANASAASDRATCVLVDVTFDHDVSVPSGADCSFTRVSVRGDVVVAPGATLADVDGTIDGDVLVYPAATFIARRTTVHGDVEAERSARVDLRDAAIDGDVETEGVQVLKVVGGTVAGDVEVERGRVVTLEHVAVGGDVELSDVRGSGAVSVVGARIQGDLEVEDNGRPVHLIGNHVGGDLEADGNRDLTISDNVVEGDLECEGNRPAPVGSGNTVGGDLEGQCVGFDADPVLDVLSVTIDQGDVSLAAGATTILTATVVTSGGADAAVAWASSDETVATIDAEDGTLAAIASGQTRVTATSVFDGAVADTVVVTVAGAGSDPVVSSFAATVVPDGRLELAWSATGADAYDVHALRDGDPSDALPVATGISGTTVTIDIPTRDRQTLRLTARGDGGETTRTTTPDHVVVSSGDYDPYDAFSSVPEPEVPGTLRSVLANAPSGTTVGFAADVAEVVLHGVDLEPVPGLLADAHLVLRSDVVISGPPSGVTIRGASGQPAGDDSQPLTWRSRVVLVPPGTEARLENLTITGGEFIYFGAGVQNHGTLTLAHVHVTGNRAFGFGGGVHNTSTGSLHLDRSTLADNRAVTTNAEMATEWIIRGEPAASVTFSGADGYGGGLYNAPGGVVTLADTPIRDNEVRVSGGGVYNAGTLDLNASDVTGNVADFRPYGGPSDFGYGGGIYNDGILDVRNGAIDDNTVASQGGGLYHDHENGFSTLGNVTIRGNLAGTSGDPADPGYGGGIMHHHYQGEEDRLSLAAVDFGAGNTPQNLLVNDRGLRTADLRPFDPYLDLPNPDDRNR